MAKSNVLGYVVIAFMILTIAQIVYMQVSIDQASRDYMKQTTAMASGVASLCFNMPPDDIILGCNLTIPWGYYYSCNNITASDANYGTVFMFNSTFITPITMFNVLANGTFNMTPPKGWIGNHSVRLFVRDDSRCLNDMFFKDFNITIIDAHHPPYLIRNIPDHIMQQYTAVSYLLNDYFADLDDDNLTYRYFLSAPKIVSITINNESLVTVKGADCGDAYVIFVATDPYNLSNTSNTIKYTVTGCPEEKNKNGAGGGGSSGAGQQNLCTPDWRCGKWSKCMIDNVSTMECRDYNACDPRHYDEFLTKNCTYVSQTYTCMEDWQCDNWSTCINNIHTRACIDKNSCGTNESLPIQLEKCTPIATCFNGIKDGNETGIDCGGQCGACKNIEMPSQQVPPISTSVLIASALTLAFILLLLFAFRKHIMKWFLGFRKEKKTRKVYLKDLQKEKLLQEVYIIQTRLEEERYSHAIMGISKFSRDFFRELLNIEHLSKDTLQQNLPSLKDKELEAIMYEFYAKLAGLGDRQEKSEIERAELQALIDEILHNVYLLSRFTEKDALVCVKERIMQTTSSYQECYLLLSNLYIALEFNEIAYAKRLYNELLSKYEQLLVSEKNILYPDLLRTYTVINYLSEFL